MNWVRLTNCLRFVLNSPRDVVKSVAVKHKHQAVNCQILGYMIILSAALTTGNKTFNERLQKHLLTV